MILDDKKKRYAEVAKNCKSCKAYRPRTKQQCKIWQLLLIEQQPDMVKNESCFLERGVSCRGYVWNGK